MDVCGGPDMYRRHIEGLMLNKNKLPCQFRDPTQPSTTAVNGALKRSQIALENSSVDHDTSEATRWAENDGSENEADVQIWITAQIESPF